MKIHELLNEVVVNFHISKADKNISTYKVVLGKQVLDKPHSKLGVREVIATTPYGKVALANVRKKQQALVGIDKEGKASVIVELSSEGKGWKVQSLVAVDNNEFPAHKVYAAFIKAGNMMISGSQQSPGGMSVWKKLSKENGINVYGWNKATKQPVNLGDEFDDESDSHASPYMIDYMKDERKVAAKAKELSPKDAEAFDKEIKHLSNITKNVVLVATKE
jgi:hypothetical protein